MKDGGEKRVEVELILAYPAPDESVGIFGGFYVAGIEVDGDFLEVDDQNVRLQNGTMTRRYVFEAKAAAVFEKLCADSTESLYDDD